MIVYLSEFIADYVFTLPQNQQLHLRCRTWWADRTHFVVERRFVKI